MALVVAGLSSGCSLRDEPAPPPEPLFRTAELPERGSMWQRGRAPCIEVPELREALEQQGLDLVSIADTRPSAFDKPPAMAVALALRSDPLRRAQRLVIEPSWESRPCSFDVHRDASATGATASPDRRVLDRLRVALEGSSVTQPGGHHLRVVGDGRVASCLPVEVLAARSRRAVVLHPQDDSASGAIAAYVGDLPGISEHPRRCAAFRSVERHAASRVERDSIWCAPGAISEALLVAKNVAGVMELERSQKDAVAALVTLMNQPPVLPPPESLCARPGTLERTLSDILLTYLFAHEVAHLEADEAFVAAQVTVDPTVDDASALLSASTAERVADRIAFLELDGIYGSLEREIARETGDPTVLVQRHLALTLYLAVLEANALIDGAGSAAGRMEQAELRYMEAAKAAGLPDEGIRLNRTLVALAGAMRGGSAAQITAQLAALSSAKADLARAGYVVSDIDVPAPEPSGERKLRVAAAAQAIKADHGVFIAAYEVPIPDTRATREGIVDDIANGLFASRRTLVLKVWPPEPQHVQAALDALEPR